VRLLVGVDHRIVLPASALFGASFLIACDLVARTILAPVEIPVGVVTAMIGGPFFLWLLVRPRLIRPFMNNVHVERGLAGPRLAWLAIVVLTTVIVHASAGAQAQHARRIVSLVPSLTETLFAIGAGPAVVGVGSFDSYPPEVTKLPRVGALVDPDVERILALQPDLVITYGSQTVLETQLARANIRTYSYRHGGLDEVVLSIKEVGRASGHITEAEALAARITSQLDALRARVRGRPRPRTLLVLSRQPGTLREVYASGGVGFLHEMLDAAGGANVFADANTESVQPSTETLLARSPQVILEVSAEGLFQPRAAARERNVWSAMASIPAVKDGRVYFLSGNHLVVPGPRVVQGAEDFARALHPEVFGGSGSRPAQR
jgi:iron complex transport system substrate-binding protein